MDSQMSVSIQGSGSMELSKATLWLSKATLSHWVIEVLQAAYQLSGVPIPRRVRAHSTRDMATLSAVW